MVNLATIFQNLPNTRVIKEVNNINDWNLCTFQLDSKVDPLVHLLDRLENMFVPFQIAADSQTKNHSMDENFMLIAYETLRRGYQIL